MIDQADRREFNRRYADFQRQAEPYFRQLQNLEMVQQRHVILSDAGAEMVVEWTEDARRSRDELLAAVAHLRREMLGPGYSRFFLEPIEPAPLPLSLG